MTPTQRALILAALGLTPRDGVMPRWSSGNEYETMLLGLCDWMKMAADGLAVRDYRSSLYLFHVTRLGADAAGVLGRCRREDVGR